MFQEAYKIFGESQTLPPIVSALRDLGEPGDLDSIAKSLYLLRQVHR